jgi:DNA-binding protein HU-beta
MKVKKQDVINNVAVKMDCSKVEAEKFLDAVLETISAELVSGNEVGLVGFGTFRIQDRKARKGRNPKTGEEMEIPAVRSPAFRAGKSLKESVNNSK